MPRLGQINDARVGHERVVVTLSAVSVGNGESPGRIVNEGCEFIDQLAGLLRIEKQITNFADPVLEIEIEGGPVQNAILEWRNPSAIHVVGPGEIQIPG